MGRPASDLRDRAVRAAIRLAASDGASGVTFDAVAEAIGSSKGAVLHHFATKDALLQAVVEGLVAEYRTTVESVAAADPNPVGAFARAMLDCSTPTELNRALRGLLAVILERPDRSEPIRQFYHWCYQHLLDDGIDPVHAGAVMLASDGMWLGELLGLPPLPDRIRSETHAWLRGLTRGVSAVP
ncbi:MAG: TetR/AcrR family transcriptional regulator [Gemmatimonadaceae bacterium]|jgi:AcrR family transcriptional regulator|nr:TetR/AcrR family transcriptional regulator [Gemmatimonadaceae bacterium]